MITRPLDSLAVAMALVLAPVLALAEPTRGAPADYAKTPEEIVYQPVPNYGGIEAVLLEGDPFADGFYVMRVRFPDGVTSPPHAHDQNRHITVLEGVWHFGVGESGDCADTMPIAAGGFAKHPAGLKHFDGACSGPTIVQISGYGPVKTEFHTHETEQTR